MGRTSTVFFFCSAKITLQMSLPVSRFFCWTFRVQTLANVVHAAGGGVTTEHLTGRSTHADLSRCAPCSTVFHMYFSSHAPALAQGFDDSSQHGSRVLKTVRLLHGHSSISCLVATSWACLSVVPLFLTDWRRDDPSGGGWFGRMAEQSPLTGMRLGSCGHDHKHFAWVEAVVLSAESQSQCKWRLPPHFSWITPASVWVAHAET